MKQNKKKAMKVPFYAQLLSKQEMQHAGGNPAAMQSNKYPSDRDDTEKFPSDGDDSSPVNDDPEWKM